LPPNSLLAWWTLAGSFLHVHWVLVTKQGMTMAEKGDKPLARLVPNPKLRLREQLREVMRFKHHASQLREYLG